MMKVKAFVPKKLPLKKKLHWECFVPYLGKAHRVLGEFNEILEEAPLYVFSFLRILETIFSVHTSDHNYLRALDYARKKGIRKPPTNQFILKLHALVKSHTLTRKKDIGHFRDRQNWIGLQGSPIEKARFYPPKASSVPSLMKNLRGYLHYPEKDPLIQLAIYFAQFLTIHPFMDGNGRVGRILLAPLFCQKKLVSHPLFFMSGYFNRNYDLYFEKLFELSEKDNWETWIIFFLEGVIEEGGGNCKRAKKLSNLYHTWKRKLEKFFPPVRIERNLKFFFTHPIFKREDFHVHDKIFKLLDFEERDGCIFCTKILKTRE